MVLLEHIKQCRFCGHAIAERPLNHREEQRVKSEEDIPSLWEHLVYGDDSCQIKAEPLEET